MFGMPPSFEVLGNYAEFDSSSISKTDMIRVLL